MSIFKVEKNVPIPTKGKKSVRGRKSIYPWVEMKVRDSFFVPLPAGKDLTIFRNAIAVNAAYHGKRHKMKFSVHKIAGGIRVWRIA